MVYVGSRLRVDLVFVDQGPDGTTPSDISAITDFYLIVTPPDRRQYVIPRANITVVDPVAGLAYFDFSEGDLYAPRDWIVQGVADGFRSVPVRFRVFPNPGS